MSGQLRIVQLLDSGNQDLDVLQSGEVIIGREPDSGIQVSGEAVSRNHGLFFRAKNHWLYKDIGSTNGSWLNGNDVYSNRWYMVRAGDIIQMADTAIRLQSVSESKGMSVGDFGGLGGRSLLVFANGEFFDDFAVPEYGRALVIGGNNSDLQLIGDMGERPSLVFERRGDDICAFSISKENDVTVDGELLQETVVLTDSQEIILNEYSILVNDPQTSASSSFNKKYNDEGAFGILKDWGEGTAPDLIKDISILNEGGKDPKRVVNIPFGSGSNTATNAMAAGDTTIDLDPDSIEAAKSGYADYYSNYNQPNKSSGDNLIALSAFILFLLLILVVLYVWFLI